VTHTLYLSTKIKNITNKGDSIIKPEKVLIIFRRKREKAAKRYLLKLAKGLEDFTKPLPVNSKVYVYTAKGDFFDKIKRKIMKSVGVKRGK